MVLMRSIFKNKAIIQNKVEQCFPYYYYTQAVLYWQEYSDKRDERFIKIMLLLIFVNFQAAILRTQFILYWFTIYVDYTKQCLSTITSFRVSPLIIIKPPATTNPILRKWVQSQLGSIPWETNQVSKMVLIILPSKTITPKLTHI